MVSPVPNWDYKIKVYDMYDKKKLLHVQYVSDYICAFMFIRLYFMFKCRFNYSRYRDAFSKTICKEHKFYPSNWFIFKVKFEKKPQKTIGILFVCSVIMITFWILTFEIEYLLENTRNVNPVFTAFYMTMITITTVGYGDLTPQTATGRVIAVVAAVWGIVLISFIVTCCSNLIELSDNEVDAIDRIDHSRVAAKAISKSFKYF